MSDIVLAHGGGGPVETLAGVGPVILGIVMLAVITLLMFFERGREPDVNEGVRDTTPSPGRQMFDGRYDFGHLMLVADVESAFDQQHEERIRDVAPA